MTKRYSLIIAVSLALALALVLIAPVISCRQKELVSEKIAVAVSIPPQVEFVEAVGGRKVDIIVMVPPGTNLHTYEPKPSQITSLAEAEIYAKVGAGVEFEIAWMDKLISVNRKMLVVDSSEGIDLMDIEPHTWLSPLNAKVMVQNIYAGLVQIDPGDRAYYEQNRDTYLRNLTELDQDIRDTLLEIQNRRFMVYHPAFGYFARDYNLNMIPIEKDGKEPTAAGIAHLIEQAREHNIRAIFVSPQFNPQSAEVIADAIGGRIVSIDTLAKDYIANLRILLGELAQAME